MDMIATLDSTRYHNLDTYNNSNHNTADKLPVVELRPFTTKQWLPSKSRPQGSNNAAANGPSRAHTSLGISTSSVIRGMTPRSTTNVGPCPRAFSVTGEKLTKHPPLKEGKTDAWKPEVPVTAFISKPTRQKTTLEDIHSGQNINSKYSCMKRSLTEVNITQQQNIRVKGKRMEKLPPKLSNLYCDPWELYANTNSPTKQMMEETLFMRIESLETAYAQLDENIYDRFDRAHTLPCIVKPAQMMEKVESPRIPQPSARTMSTGTGGSLSGKDGIRSVVNNSLDMMSHTGRPLGVEHQLTQDLKQNLQHFRRTKDNIMLGHFVGAKGLPGRIDTGQLTPGQANLRSSFNKNKKNVNMTKSKSITSESLSTASSQRPTTFGVFKQAGSESGSKSIPSGSWCQADSIPVPSAIRSMTQVEFNEAHRVIEESQQDAELEDDGHEMDANQNGVDGDISNANENKMELESVRAASPLTSISQEILTIPTDEPIGEVNQEGLQSKSTTFITEKDNNEGAKESEKEDNSTPPNDPTVPQ